MEMVKVLFFETGEEPKEISIEHDLDAWSKIVDGQLEMRNLGSGYSLVCNEMGRLIGLPKNQVLMSDSGSEVVYCGNFFIHKFDDEGNTIDLSNEDIKILKSHFRPSTLTNVDRY